MPLGYAVHLWQQHRSAAQPTTDGAVVVIGDFGGTSCRLQLLACPDLARDRVASRPDPLFSAGFAHGGEDGDFGSLLEILRHFLDEAAAARCGRRVAMCSIAVCGPVIGGRCVMLAPAFGRDGWTADASALSSDLGCPVTLLNDFHAVGLALPLVPQSERWTLYAPPSDAPGGDGDGDGDGNGDGDGDGDGDGRGVLACLGPGTGLGQCYAVWTGEGYQVCCSEGGMSDFVARSPDEVALRDWLAAGGDEAGGDSTVGGESSRFVDVEHVVSGEGIANIYRWLRETRPGLVDRALDRKIARAEHPAALIAAAASGGPGGGGGSGAGTGEGEGNGDGDELCTIAIDMFLRALGAEAGNLACRYQAHGGVFIAGGGIAKKLLPLVRDGRVAQAYADKGRNFACYASCPLYVCSTDGDELGLMGAWQWAREQLRVMS